MLAHPFNWLIYNAHKIFSQLYRHRQIFHLVILVLSALKISAQDLDPRAYIRLPVKTTTLVTGFAYSYGGVVTEPTAPVNNIKADVQSASLGVAHTFNFFGLSSQALVALPFSWAQVSGEVGDQQKRITRAGLSDMRMRFSVLFLGAPAATLAELMKKPARKTILGASINIVAPAGQFFSDKLVNLGTNRWAFRPELALSQPLNNRWMLDLYTGVWFFTDNDHFYPGNSVRSQNAMGTLQGHLSYNINALTWVAFDATYYTGGASSIDGVNKDDRQSNVRLGVTAVVPTGKRSSIKFAASTGAIVRLGQNFTSFSIGWQQSWFGGLKK
jgi:hypothetical protein